LINTFYIALPFLPQPLLINDKLLSKPIIIILVSSIAFHVAMNQILRSSQKFQSKLLCYIPPHQNISCDHIMQIPAAYNFLFVTFSACCLYASLSLKTVTFWVVSVYTSTLFALWLRWVSIQFKCLDFAYSCVLICPSVVLVFESSLQFL
jgi:hypothetical protein